MRKTIARLVLVALFVIGSASGLGYLPGLHSFFTHFGAILFAFSGILTTAVGFGWMKLGWRLSEPDLAKFQRQFRWSGPLLIALALLQYFGNFSPHSRYSAEHLPPGFVLYHRYSLPPGDNRWYWVKSTEGRFSILMPLPSDDKSFDSSDTEHPGRISAIVGEDKRGFYFSATEKRHPPGDPEQLRAEAFQKMTGPEFLTKQQLMVGESPAIETKMSFSTTVGWGRVIFTGDASYMLTVECPTAMEAEIAQQVPHFFESFKLRTEQ